MNPMVKWIGGGTAAAVIGLIALGTVLSGSDAQADSAGADDAASVAARTEKQPFVPAIAQAHLSGEADIASPETIAPDQPEAAPAQLQPATVSDAFTVKRILPIKGPIRYGEWFWDDKGVPAGPIVVTVDLDARVVSVFQDGYEIGATAALLGTDDYPTPLGVHPILEKKRHNISSIYDVPMPYTMRLTWDGVSLHASKVENGYASHGCVGMPEEFAARVFAKVKKGDKVIITRGQTMGMGDTIL